MKPRMSQIGRGEFQSTNLQIYARLLSVLLGAFVMACASSYAAVSESPHVHVRWEHGLLDLMAKEVPLEEVIKQVGVQTGLEIELRAPCAEPISVNISGLPLREAVKIILKQRNYIFLGSVSEEQSEPAPRLIVLGPKSAGTPEDPCIQGQPSRHSQSAEIETMGSGPIGTLDAPAQAPEEGLESKENEGGYPLEDERRIMKSTEDPSEEEAGEPLEDERMIQQQVSGNK